MDRHAIRSLLIQLLEEDLGQTFADLDETKDLRQDLGLDSVDLVSVVSQIERRCKVRLEQKELQELVTVKDVLDLLERKLNMGAAA